MEARRAVVDKELANEAETRVDAKRSYAGLVSCTWSTRTFSVHLTHFFCCGYCIILTLRIQFLNEVPGSCFQELVIGLFSLALHPTTCRPVHTDNARASWTGSCFDSALRWEARKCQQQGWDNLPLGHCIWCATCNAPCADACMHLCGKVGYTCKW